LGEVKVLVRQISTGLYWKSGTGWVQADEAEVFNDSSVALLYCIREGIRDVHVILSFDDSRYDLVMRPFGEKGNERTSRELVDETRSLTKKSKEVSARTKALLAGAHQTLAELKERRKGRPFKRKPIADSE
jgi:hypothetical protein